MKFEFSFEENDVILFGIVIVMLGLMVTICKCSDDDRHTPKTPFQTEQKK